MKRRALKVVVFLLLGAIVNVAVAWGCAAWSRLSTPDPTPPMWAIRQTQLSPIETAVIPLFESMGFVQTPQDQSSMYHLYPVHISGTGIDVLVWIELEHPLPHSIRQGMLLNRRAVMQFAAGLPIRSMEGDLWNGADMRSRALSAAEHWNSHTAIRLVPSRDERVLPLRPIWPGFAVNTIFYAAVLWMLFAMPFALRRRRRIKRGLCPACAYPVGTSPVCTECGKAIPTVPKT